VSIATEETQTVIPKTVSVGEAVMTRHGNYVWEGEHELEGMESIIAHVRDGFTGFKGSSDSVAPLAVEALVNPKDSRISVTKQPENKPGAWVGPWAAVIAGEEEFTNPTWHRTKREGVEVLARKLAIRDWHANGGVVTV
jgi:hypothetical protein